MAPIERSRVAYSEDCPSALVEFVVIGNRVVYCGVTDKNRLKNTTATDAERIIEVISLQLQRARINLHFYELSTHVSWVCERGAYAFHRVVRRRYEGEITLDWVREKCPGEILSLFEDQIGGDHPESLAAIDSRQTALNSEWARHWMKKRRSRSR